MSIYKVVLELKYSLVNRMQC